LHRQSGIGASLGRRVRVPNTRGLASGADTGIRVAEAGTKLVYLYSPEGIERGSPVAIPCGLINSDRQAETDRINVCPLSCILVLTGTVRARKTKIAGFVEFVS
jgi:hypothetical protein